MTQETVVISRAEYEELKRENARLAQALLNLQEQIRLANKQRFGRKSEQSQYDDGSEQLTMDLLFNEVEAISDIAPTPAEPDLSIVKAHKRKKHATKRRKAARGRRDRSRDDGIAGRGTRLSRVRG